MKKSNRVLFKIPTTSKELVHISDFTACRISQIHFCHAILFIMKLRSWSLIHQLSSPAPISKKTQNVKRHLDHFPSECKWRLDFSSQKMNQFAPLLLPGTRRKRKRRVICSGQILICSRITTLVPLIRTSRRQTTKYVSRISPQSIIPSFRRSLLLLKTQLSEDNSSFREHRHPEVDSSHPRQDGYNNRPPWSLPTFMEIIKSTGHSMFQMQQLLFLRRLL